MKKHCTLSLVIVFIIISNIFMYFVHLRWDITEDKRYTLNRITKKFLDTLKTDVKITVFLEGKDLPISFKKFRRAIKANLEQIQIYSQNHIKYEFLDLYSNKITDNERKELIKKILHLGIQPIQNTEVKSMKATKSLIFAGAIIQVNINGQIKETAINFLDYDPSFQYNSIENLNNSLQTLEYKIINAILRLLENKRKKIAFIEGHGELDELEVMDLEASLINNYDIQRGQIYGVYGILDTFDVVIIAKPTKPFTEKDKFVLDQYIMKGGKVLWLVDGVSVSMDSIYYYQKAFAFPILTQYLDIADLLYNYGVRINSDIVQDLRCSNILLKFNNTQGQSTDFRFPWLYFPLIVSKNNHSINRNIDLIRTEFVSSIDTIKKPKIQKTVLLSTSDASKILKVSSPLEINFKEILQKPQPEQFTSKNVPIAVLLSGEFESLWAGRFKTTYDNVQIIPKSKKTEMIIVADGDIAKNVVKSNGEYMPLDFDKFSLTAFKGNKQFLINCIDYLAGYSELMQLRMKQIKIRLLNSKITNQEKLFWQYTNLLLPIVIIVIFGALNFYVRKLKYAK